jgi:hypothetical protein
MPSSARLAARQRTIAAAFEHEPCSGVLVQWNHLNLSSHAVRQ